MAGLMKRALVSAAMIGGLFGAVAAQAAPKEDLKGTNVVLVHGAFADGSSLTVDPEELIVIASGVISMTEPATANFRLVSDV